MAGRPRRGRLVDPTPFRSEARSGGRQHQNAPGTGRLPEAVIRGGSSPRIQPNQKKRPGAAPEKAISRLHTACRYRRSRQAQSAAAARIAAGSATGGAKATKITIITNTNT